MQQSEKIAIGLMSGTSMDGVDAALLTTDGVTISNFGPTAHQSYTDAERQIIVEALKVARLLRNRKDRPPVIAKAEEMITAVHAKLVNALIQNHNIAREDIDFIGFHGQTIFHAPDKQLTIQIGDPEQLAHTCQIPVISDFRAADVAAGGEGAPLAPIFHQALAAYADLTGPTVFLNIGGVSNITLVEEDAELIAFDTGPGNALIDDWVSENAQLAYDEGGRVAAKGNVDKTVLSQLLDHKFFAEDYPKSLDRNAFHTLTVDHLNLADGAATLTAFTIESIGKGIELTGCIPQNLVVSGGGSHNETIMRGLRARLAGTRVQTASDIGLDPDFVEAQAFAYLAVRSNLGLPISFPGTTAVPEPLTGGMLTEVI